MPYTLLDFIQVMIIVPMGIVMYFVLAYQQRNWGLISQYRGVVEYSSEPESTKIANQNYARN